MTTPYSAIQRNKKWSSVSSLSVAYFITTTALTTLPSVTMSSTLSTPFGGVSAKDAADASSFAKSTARDLKENLMQGNLSLQVLAIFGGLAMIVVSILGFISHLFGFAWISAIFDVYTFFLGIMIVILESSAKMSFLNRITSKMYRNARFLTYLWGRGIVYFVAGSLQLSQREFLDLIVGAYVCFVGILFIVIGRRASKKLAAARRTACTAEELQENFAKCDVDGKGALTVAQFGEMTRALGLDLNRREVEAAFIQLDYSQTGRLTYESIQMWWTKGADEEIFTEAVIA